MILRYVLRNFARRKTRTLMGVLGVFCTLALLTAVHVGLESVAVSYVDLVSLHAGKADIVIRREGSEWFRPEAFDPAEVERRTASNAHLKGLSPRLMAVRPVGGSGDSRFAVVVGIDPKREKDLGIDGFTPWPALTPGTCALSESLAKQLGGDTVEIGDISLKRVATIERQLVFPQHLKDFVVMDLETARGVMSEGKGVHFLAGAFRDPQAYYDARDLRKSVLSLKEAGEAIAEDLGRTFEISLPKAEAITHFEQVSGPLRAVFGIFALVALAITALLIYSVLSVSVEERIREHAILRTIGARKGHIFALVIAESAGLCLIGVVPGVFAGLLLSRGILALAGLAMGGGAGTIALELSGSTARFCLGAGAAVSLVSALLPAIRSTQWRIVDALHPLRRGQIAPASVEGGVSRPLLLSGLALSAISGTVFFLLPNAVLSGDPSLIGGVALGLLVVILSGFTMIAVAAAPVVEQAVLFVLGGLFGPSAELAARNLGRHRRRNVTTSMMFALSVSFVLFLSSLVALFSRTSLSFIERKVGSDLRISMPDPKEGELMGELQGIIGVDKVASAVHLRSRSAEGIAYDVVASDLVGMKHLWVVPFGVDAGLDEAIAPRPVQWEEGDASAFRALAGDKGEGETSPTIVSLSMARHLDLRKGSLINVSFRLGSEKNDLRARVVGIASSLPGFGNFRARAGNAQGSGLLLSRATFDQMTKTAPREAFEGFALAKVGQDAKKVASTVRDRLGLQHRLGVECAEEEKHEAEILYWVTQVLFAMLLGVAVTIALFGLVASMATAVIERRWEVGVLKAVGLRRGHLFRMFAAEAVTLTVSSGLLGGAMGFLLAWLFVVQAALLMEIPVAFTLPWVTFSATFVVCVVAGLLASWLPTRRMLQRPVAEILRGGL
ncbi:MAG TPA: FtsX-like permease family protein [Planctomycetota bacterium]|nr:FtsX-like permease family protein [Planctomycetota bacterium]